MNRGRIVFLPPPPLLLLSWNPMSTAAAEVLLPSNTAMVLVSTAALLVGLVPSEANAAVVAARDESAYLHIGKDILRGNDLFSASWIMDVGHFRKIHANEIHTVESGCFVPFRQFSAHVRMTRDWLEFTVEHMSKWWKTFNIFAHPTTMRTFIERIESFTSNSITTPGLHHTIAIVPFQAYHGNDREGRLFTSKVLSACIRSMTRYGIRRIVVVVASYEERKTYSRLLKPSLLQQSELVVFRVVHNVSTKYIPTNLPYGAIVGLQNAFVNDVDDWLGTENSWNSVFLTEPDTLLHIKPNVLPELIRRVEQDGWVLSPHRLQPIPHASDIHEDLTIVPNTTKHQVRAIDSYSTKCMDAGNDRPPKTCKNFWWLCGFQSGNRGNFDYLEPYGLMRLSHGIGVTMIVGSEHGRRCHLESEHTNSYPIVSRDSWF